MTPCIESYSVLRGETARGHDVGNSLTDPEIRQCVLSSELSVKVLFLFQLKCFISEPNGKFKRAFLVKILFVVHILVMACFYSVKCLLILILEHVLLTHFKYFM